MFLHMFPSYRLPARLIGRRTPIKSSADMTSPHASTAMATGYPPVFSLIIPIAVGPTNAPVVLTALASAIPVAARLPVDNDTLCSYRTDDVLKAWMTANRVVHWKVDQYDHLRVMILKRQLEFM